MYSLLKKKEGEKNLSNQFYKTNIYLISKSDKVPAKNTYKQTISKPNPETHKK